MITRHLLLLFYLLLAFICHEKIYTAASMIGLSVCVKFSSFFNSEEKAAGIHRIHLHKVAFN